MNIKNKPRIQGHFFDIGNRIAIRFFSIYPSYGMFSLKTIQRKLLNLHLKSKLTNIWVIREGDMNYERIINNIWVINWKYVSFIIWTKSIYISMDERYIYKHEYVILNFCCENISIIDILLA